MGAATGGVRERLKSRFMAIGVLIAAVFGSLTAKLWSMQVLSSKEYVEAANENQYTTIKTPAARGRIFDTQGIVMVDNKTRPAVLADADVADDRTTLLRLSALLGLPYAVVRQRIKDTSGGAQAQREVSSAPRSRDVAFLLPSTLMRFRASMCRSVRIAYIRIKPSRAKCLAMSARFPTAF